MKQGRKRFLNKLVAFMAAVAMITMIPSMNLQAADGKTYTVTFRPGNVGYFAIKANPEGDRKMMAEEVAAQLFAGYDYTVTKNGAIKVSVEKDQPVPETPTAYIQTENGYFVKNTSEWELTGNVDRNMDCVVDYGKLIDGVEYIVKYVDSASGESIAPVYITQGNIGDTRTITAPVTITISGSTVYHLTGTERVELTLDADTSKNIVVFSYTMLPAGTTVEEVVVGVDGQIITTTDIITTVDGGTDIAAGGAVAGDGMEADGEDGDNTAGGGMEITEELTPLADGIDETAGEEENTVQINEEEIPLASGTEPEPYANMAVIGAVFFAIGAVLIALVWLIMKKRRTALTEMIEKE